MAKKNQVKETNQTEAYSAVSNNIYFTGTSYRVRVSKNGQKFSRNFTSKKKAYAYRKELLSAD